jgi:hypothetical protein
MRTVRPGSSFVSKFTPARAAAQTAFGLGGYLPSAISSAGSGARRTPMICAASLRSSEKRVRSPGGSYIAKIRTMMEKSSARESTTSIDQFGGNRMTRSSRAENAREPSGVPRSPG